MQKVRGGRGGEVVLSPDGSQSPDLFSALSCPQRRGGGSKGNHAAQWWACHAWVPPTQAHPSSAPHLLCGLRQTTFLSEPWFRHVCNKSVLDRACWSLGGRNQGLDGHMLSQRLDVCLAVSNRQIVYLF